MSIVAAAGFAVLIGGVAWFEAVYLTFGLTGKDPAALLNVLAAVLAFGIAMAWPLYGARRAAQVVRRACYLGLSVAGLLPVVSFAVMLLWQRATDRPDLGMGGMMLYALPFVALGVAAVLALVFGLGVRLAERRLQGPAAQADNR